MEIEVKIPVTMEERIALGPELVRFPASWEEYWELLDKVQYNIEFQNNEIIAMSYESNPHGNIIFEFGRLLGNIFISDNFQGFAENRPVYMKECKTVYNPDIFLLDRPSELFEHSPGLNVETNPFLIVEVLSKSTYDHDWEDKLPYYKTLPTVEQIIYIESRFPAVTIFRRLASNGNGWEKFFYNEQEEQIEVRGHALTLKQIYRKTNYFSKA